MLRPSALRGTRIDARRIDPYRSYKEKYMSISPVSSSSTAAAAAVLAQPEQTEAMRASREARNVASAAAQSADKVPPAVNSDGQIIGTLINTTA